jgi:uncharacterized protein YdaU (DUF1376 family)
MNPPKMPIHIGDLMRDTGHLRALLMGAYLLLLMHHWSTGALPDDDDQLSAIARLSPPEWRKAKPILEKFFKPGWIHGRVQKDLASANESYQKRAKAGEKGGKAKAETKQSSSNATAGPEQPLTLDQIPKKDSEPAGSGAGAPVDHRKRLFDEGLKKLAAMTGKGPDACRSFVGKCLKAAEDNAVTVLGLIEDAERNQTVNPTAWIVARLQPTGNPNGRRTVQDAARDLHENLLERIAAFDEPAPRGICDGTGPDVVRLLPAGRRE